MTRRLVKQPLIGLACAGVLASVFTASASAADTTSPSLLLDFGLTGPKTADLKNSPAFNDTANKLSVSYTTPTWNAPLGDSDVAAGGLKFINGNTASGVALDLSAAVATGTNFVTQLTFGDSTHQPSSVSDLGAQVSAGVYTSRTSVGIGGIWANAAGVHTAVGAQITGLGAGTYTIYVTARNTSGGSPVPNAEDISVAATTAGTTYTLPTTTGKIDNNDPTNADGNAHNTTVWLLNGNYYETTVTTTLSLSAITITAQGDAVGGTSEGRGFLNSIEIVGAVPEPSSLCVIGLGAIGLLSRRRRSAERRIAGSAL